MENPWHNKRILITGVSGTVGSELLKQLVQKAPLEIIGLDNNESAIFFQDVAYKNLSNINFYMCDIKKQTQLNRYFKGVDVVIHSAARKHVILCEKAPNEAVETNILGTQNVINAAIDNNVERVIFTSSDKAVNPTNVMGTSKLMGERLMTSANALKRGQGPIFASTRFGNVLGSNGSVIPLFKRQILAGGPVTLTDEGMSRFVMTLDEAASLVMDSVFIAKGGEVFVTKMPAILIKDLATAMVEIFQERGEIKTAVDIKIIGAKPGEKLYEELINEEEIRRTYEIEKYFAVLPAFKAVYADIDYTFDIEKKQVDRIYRSDLKNVMSKDELKNYLITKKLV
ncbi:polysaccharide biosynthesis protein [Akkermansiaceae bacterium]|nr:polysaccharide biosynthesis protein [Akkermansiaceae bacterium]